MLWERKSFDDAESLLRAARASVREGRWVRVGRDDEEPALLWLDRLALERSDWQEAIDEVLLRLGHSSDPSLRGALVDLLERAGSAPRFVATMETLCSEPGQAPTSDASTAWDPSATPRSLSDFVLRHRERASSLNGQPSLVLLRRPRTELIRLTDASDLLGLARACAAYGSSRTGGTVAGTFTLDWLRERALFAAWVRAALVDVLGQLLHGDAAEVQAVVEYACRSGDKGVVAALLERWVRGGGGADTPARFPGAPAPTLAGCIDWVLTRAGEEASTRPQPPRTQA